ncbi:hypothetical protein [Sphingomonas sp.]|uniref:hypothetical protein n=1 Tax=Sphingomonas sp. TaxID=28214 RepID=UPI003CC55B85
MAETKMQHHPHVGVDYQSGHGGKRVSVMGYSHHSDDDDHEDFTTRCVANVQSGAWPHISFFNQIASYFHSANDRFWSTVAFLNFLPRRIGGGDERFDHGTADDTEEGRHRVREFLERHRPDFLFVFSRKAWASLPRTLEDERDGNGGARISPDHDFDRQHYRLSDGHVVQAIGLRHPQGAEKDVMRRAVASALALEPAPPA